MTNYTKKQVIVQICGKNSDEHNNQRSYVFVAFLRASN